MKTNADSASPLDIQLDGAWRDMAIAPKDGTQVELLVRHLNWEYAGAHDRDKWEEIVRAHWIDFNGGGWTWTGLMGSPICWRISAV